MGFFKELHAEHQDDSTQHCDDEPDPPTDDQEFNFDLADEVIEYQDKLRWFDEALQDLYDRTPGLCEPDEDTLGLYLDFVEEQIGWIPDEWRVCPKI